MAGRMASREAGRMAGRMASREAGRMAGRMAGRVAGSRPIGHRPNLGFRSSYAPNLGFRPSRAPLVAVCSFQSECLLQLSPLLRLLVHE